MNIPFIVVKASGSYLGVSDWVNFIWIYPIIWPSYFQQFVLVLGVVNTHKHALVLFVDLTKVLLALCRAKHRLEIDVVDHALPQPVPHHINICEFLIRCKLEPRREPVAFFWHHLFLIIHALHECWQLHPALLAINLIEVQSALDFPFIPLLKELSVSRDMFLIMFVLLIHKLFSRILDLY